MANNMSNQKKGRIIGIGGVFFKSSNPETLTNWYQKHLGFSPQVPYMDGDTVITIKWKSWEGQNENTVWAPFPDDTTYFSPSDKSFMINYVVEDIDILLERLKSEGIKQLGDISQQPFGKFAQIMDPEGNKIEFCEPNHEHFKDKY